jgi:mannitol/fructose-specific phosphotransferase system IIA component (Ntr-type)
MTVRKSVKKSVAVKAKSKPAKLFYYRIFFDDNEKKNYMKSTLTHKQVEKHLKVYEKTHQKFLNTEFVEYLKKYDKKTEMIEISDISY